MMPQLPEPPPTGDWTIRAQHFNAASATLGLPQRMGIRFGRARVVFRPVEILSESVETVTVGHPGSGVPAWVLRKPVELQGSATEYDVGAVDLAAINVLGLESGPEDSGVTLNLNRSAA